MFEPGTNQRLVYFQFDLRFTIFDFDFDSVWIHP